MSDFYIEHSSPETNEEFEKYYDKYLKNHELPSIRNASYASLKKSYIQNSRHSHYRKLWNAFNSRINEFVDAKHYLFVARKAPFGNIICGLFINIPNFLFVLKQHYNDFAKIGGEFDPERILSEIGNNESIFWEKVLQNHYLQGLLYGYGPKNSFLFTWLKQLNLSNAELKKRFFGYPSFAKYMTQSNELFCKKNVQVSDLMPPPMSISLYDEVFNRYCLEREAIIDEFKGKDFTTVVKQWLKSL